MKYAALIKDTIYVPGDERSRTRPGYPEYHQSFLTLKEFESEEEMIQHYKSNRQARYIRFEEIQFKEEVKVEISNRI